MIEVHPHLFVGNQADYEHNVKQAGSLWSVLHACKEPYHRQALGYSGRAAPKSHPEYLYARRGNQMMLNLVDVDDPAYVSGEIMDAAVAFIGEQLKKGRQVLLHCNQGVSRSPAITMLYLHNYTDGLSQPLFEDAVATFRQMYPPFSPAAGVLGFLRHHWIPFPAIDNENGRALIVKN